MKKTSLARNATLNLVRSIMSIIFPLITFPYASRILLTENMGKVSFSNSIISYFVLLAGLGIKTYAVREGSRYRNIPDKLERFSNEVFTINLFSTIASYILLVVVYFASEKLHDYRLLLITQSINIIGTTIGVEWIYTIYEDYLYITLRSIAVQALSLVLLVSFVHKPSDYIVYAGISTFAATAGNVFNFVHSRSLLRLKLTMHGDLKKHLKPIFIIFAMTAATTIYVNSDVTMLGYFNGDTYVGLYNVATKLYSIMKTLMAACITVALPRLSNEIAEKNDSEYRKESGMIINVMVVLLAPVVVGAFLCARDIIYIISGPAYMESITAYKVLCLSLVFSVFAIYLTNVILLPQGKEKTIMYATFCSAAVNILLNVILLPKYMHVGAAITTLIAEMIVFLWQFSAIGFKLPVTGGLHRLWPVLAGCTIIAAICILIDKAGIPSLIVGFLIKVVASAAIYGAIMIKSGIIKPGIKRKNT